MIEFLQSLFMPGPSGIDWSKTEKEKNGGVHENIDNLINRIDPSTIQETRRGISPFGQYINALYKAETHGGEKREIFRSAYPSYEEGQGQLDKDNQLRMLLGIIEEVKENPEFADTLTAGTRPSVKAELDYSAQPGRWLKHTLGF